MRSIRIGIDWIAMLAGGTVGFLSLLLLFGVASQLGFFPRQGDTIQNLLEFFTDPTMLFFMAASLPGSITAGYLHASNLFSSALYGMSAIFLGVVFPLVMVVLLFLGLIGLLGGAPRTVLLAGFLLLPAIPFFVVTVCVSGIVGGVLGTLLKRWRTA